jgi:hypothetical protein
MSSINEVFGNAYADLLIDEAANRPKNLPPFHRPWKEELEMAYKKTNPQSTFQKHDLETIYSRVGVFLKKVASGDLDITNVEVDKGAPYQGEIRFTVFETGERYRYWLDEKSEAWKSQRIK